LSPLEITEEDGSPSTFPYKVKFSNATVTDNGDGTTSVAISAGSGDITSVGDVTTGAAFDGTQGSSLVFTPAAGNQWEHAAGNGYYTLSDYTTGNQYLRLENQTSSVFLPQGKLIIGDNGTTASSISLSGSDLTIRQKGKLYLGDTNRFVLDGPNNRSAFGHDQTTFVIAGATFGSKVSTFSDIATEIGMSHAAASDTAGFGSIMGAFRSRGTLASPTAVVSGDNLYDNYSLGYDGTDYAISTNISREVDGTVAANQVPGRIVLSTAGSAGILTERVRIDSAGNVGIGSTSPDSQLDVESAVPTIRWTDVNGDDYELTLDANIFSLVNITDGATIFRTTQENGFQTVGKLVTEGGAKLNGAVDASAATSVTLPRPVTIGPVSYVFPAADGSSGQVLQTNGAGTLSFATASGSGDVTAALSLTDNAVVRGDGGAKGVQTSGVVIDDSNNITGVAALTGTSFIIGANTLNTSEWANLDGQERRSGVARRGTRGPGPGYDLRGGPDAASGSQGHPPSSRNPHRDRKNHRARGSSLVGRGQTAAATARCHHRAAVQSRDRGVLDSRGTWGRRG